MKNKKLLLMPFLLTVLFFVGMNGVEAQQVGSLNAGATPVSTAVGVVSPAMSSSIQDANLVNPSEAATILYEASKYEYNNPDMTTGTTEATSAIKTQYYYAAYNEIQNGSSVKNALVESIGVINREKLKYAKALNISTQVIVDDAIDLLSQ